MVCLTSKFNLQEPSHAAIMSTMLYLALQGILSKYKVSDADLEAIMKWKHDV